MKNVYLAFALTTLLTAHAHAADPVELSIDTRRMLSYGTLSVLTGICKTPLTPQQDAEMKAGLQKAAEAQQEMTPEQFTGAMKAVGAQVGENRDQVCAGMTPEFVTMSLEQAAAGE